MGYSSYPPVPTSMSRQSSVGAGAWNGAHHVAKQEDEEGSDDDEGDEEDDDEEEEDEDDDDDEDENGDGNGSDQVDEGNESDGVGSGQKRKRSSRASLGSSRHLQGPDASPSKSAASPAESRDGIAAAGSSSSGHGQPAHKKPKPPRGSKACTHCRKLKMRCTGGENGPPCDRCRHSGYQCVFEESNRGKKAAANAAAQAQAKAEKAAQQALIEASSKGPENSRFSSGNMAGKSKGKHKQSNQDLARSLEKMESTLSTVLRALRDPNHAASLGHASGMLTRPHSPEGEKPSNHHRRHQQATPQRHHSHPGRADVFQAAPTSIAPSQLTAPAHPTALHHESSRHGAQSQAARYASNASATSSGAMPAPHSSSSHSHHGSSSSGRNHHNTSPRLHSLPPDSLNPLGLLAEASLGNQLGSIRRTKSTASNNTPGPSSGLRAGSQAGDEGADGSTNRESGDHATDTNKAVTEGHTYGKGDEAHTEPNTPALGVASKTYFRPGPMSMLPLRKVIIDRELPPELLTSGVVSDEEVLDLFSIFFHNCAQHIVLLDPEWHTPQFVCGRSPFLFTVILATASRYYTRRPDLHKKCLRQATKEAFGCLERGFKSVEIVQAFLLLTMWGQPAQRFEEDKSWIFAGIAFRIATDLNLHRKSVASLTSQPPTDDAAMIERDKEIRNRERTWIFCFVVDRSLSGQMGKPSAIREDFIIRNTPSWALHRTAQPADIALSAVVELQRLTSKQTELLYSSLSSVTGLNHDLDFSNMIKIFSDQLEEWRHHWTIRGLVIGDCHNRHPEIPPIDGTLSAREIELRQMYAAANRSTPPPDDADHTMRTLYYLLQQAPLRYHYAALSLHSFGLQFGHSIDRGVQYLRCYDAARGIFFAARDGMRPILRYTSDTLILIISFSLVFMLKLTRPTFAAYADSEEIFRLVEEGADMLEEAAAEPSHTPALYSHFLRTTLAQAKSDHAARSSSTYPSRAASPGGPHLNGNGGDGYDNASMAAAAFDLPTDAALGGHDPSLAPAAHGTRSNSLSEAALVQAFSAAASGNGMMAGLNLTGLPGYGGAAGNGNGQNGMSSSTTLQGNGGAGSITASGLHDAGSMMLDNVWWNQLVPAGLGGPLDGLNGSVEMQPISSAPGVTHTPTQGGSRGGHGEDGAGDENMIDGGHGGPSQGAKGDGTGEHAAGGVEGHDQDGGASKRDRSGSIKATTPMVSSSGAGTGVTRPSSPSNSNMLSQFGGGFLSFDFSHY